MRRVFRSQHVRDGGEGEDGLEVVGSDEKVAPELMTDAGLQAAIDEIEAARLNSLRALGIPVDE